MTPSKTHRQLARFLSYILERHPEEFGLIPDESDYVKIKELLKAFHETEGWRHIRESSLNELMLVVSDPPFEIEGSRIRAVQRQYLPATTPCTQVPKILFTCIRKKAYPHVLEKGISPAEHSRVICTPDREMAARLGRRKDRDAVLVTIHTAKTAEQSVSFQQFADMFYMTEYLPPDTFTGPPLPKAPEKEKHTGPAKTPKSRDEFGTFSVTSEMIESAVNKKAKGKKKKLEWKQERKHRRNKDKKAWPDAL